PEFVVGDEQCQESVRSRKELRRNIIRVGTHRQPCWLDAVVEVGRSAIVQLGKHHITQRYLDLPAAARDDLGQQSKGSRKSGGIVSRGVSRQGRWSKRIARQRRDAGGRLDDVAKCRITPPFQTKTGERHEENPVVPPPQRVVGEAISAYGGWFQIRQQRMRSRNEFTELALARLRCQVD